MKDLSDLLAESHRKEHALLSSIEAAAARAYDNTPNKSMTTYLEAKIRILDHLLNAVRFRT